MILFPYKIVKLRDLLKWLTLLSVVVSVNFPKWKIILMHSLYNCSAWQRTFYVDFVPGRLLGFQIHTQDLPRVLKKVVRYIVTLLHSQYAILNITFNFRLHKTDTLFNSFVTCGSCNLKNPIRLDFMTFCSRMCPASMDALRHSIKAAHDWFVFFSALCMQCFVDILLPCYKIA